MIGVLEVGWEIRADKGFFFWLVCFLPKQKGQVIRGEIIFLSLSLSCHPGAEG